MSARMAFLKASLGSAGAAGAAERNHRPAASAKPPANRRRWVVTYASPWAKNREARGWESDRRSHRRIRVSRMYYRIRGPNFQSPGGTESELHWPRLLV